MPVTEYERNHLFTWFEEHMGKERAATMMSLLPPVGWGDVATKRDLDVVVERLEAKIDAAAARMASKDDALDVKTDAVAARMASKDDLHALDKKVGAIAAQMASKDDLHAIDAKLNAVAGQMASKDDLHALQRTFVTWLLTAQATVVAVVGLLLVALR